MKHVCAMVALFCLATTAHGAQKAKGVKPKEVPFTTNWNQAIKEAQATGKMLFIFNGWERSGI